MNTKTSLSSIIFALQASYALCFTPVVSKEMTRPFFTIHDNKDYRTLTRIYAVENDDDENDNNNREMKKKTLEEKMAAWEATEEEMKAASLGGLTPKGRADGFDIGLYIAFPIIVATSLLFAVFPFIMDKIDVSSVGPPPTV